MKNEQTQESELRQYLLGEFTLEERVLIEQRLFLDGQYADFAEAVEDDLIDDYLHDDLTTGEKEKFQQHFLEDPEHHDELRIADALKRYLTSDVQVDPMVLHDGPAIREGRSPVDYSWYTRGPVVWGAQAAAGLALVSIIVWFAIQSTNRPRSKPPLQAQEQQSAPASNESNSNAGPSVNQNDQPQHRNNNSSTGKPVNDRTPSQRDRKRNLPTQFASFTILPGGLSTRGGSEANPISISSEVKLVRFNLPLVMASEYDSYRAKLRNGRHTIHNWPNISPENDNELGKVVRLDIAAILLNSQSYEIQLSGIGSDSNPEVTTYAFRVERNR